MTTDNKLKQIANIYELPLLLQVSGYRLQVNIYSVLARSVLAREEEIDIVKSITFSKDTMVFVFERGNPRHICNSDYGYGTLQVFEKDPSILRFDVYNKYEPYDLNFTWKFSLVPETNNHPNILEAFQEAVPIL